MKSLKDLMKKTLLFEIFRNKSRPKKESGQFEWAILVVDETSMKILQSCMQTHELTAENVASFESNIYSIATRCGRSFREALSYGRQAGRSGAPLFGCDSFLVMSARSRGGGLAP